MSAEEEAREQARDSLRMLCRMLPLSVSTQAMLIMMERIYRTHPHGVEIMLCNLWTVVESIAVKKLETREPGDALERMATVVVGSYFRKYGDWHAMVEHGWKQPHARDPEFRATCERVAQAMYERATELG